VKIAFFKENNFQIFSQIPKELSAQQLMNELFAEPIYQ